MFLKVGVAAAAIAALISGAAQAQSFTFDGSVGASTPLTVTSGGTTASFSSSAGPGTFSVANTGLYSSLGNALGDYANTTAGDPLTITFSKPVITPVSFSFGIEDLFGINGSDSLTLITNLGFSETVNGAIAASLEPEGAASLYNPGFTSFTITSANPYAIGGVTAVPEPITLSIMAVGLAGLAAARRRRG